MRHSDARWDLGSLSGRLSLWPDGVVRKGLFVPCALRLESLLPGLLEGHRSSGVKRHCPSCSPAVRTALYVGAVQSLEAPVGRRACAERCRCSRPGLADGTFRGLAGLGLCAIHGRGQAERTSAPRSGCFTALLLWRGLTAPPCCLGDLGAVRLFRTVVLCTCRFARRMSPRRNSFVAGVLVHRLECTHERVFDRPWLGPRVFVSSTWPIDQLSASIGCSLG